MANSLTTIEKEDALFVAKALANLGSFPENSKWLVTGASGFLGSQILNVLSVMKELGFNCEVTALDSGSRGGLREWYFANSHFMQHDVTTKWPDLEPHSHILHLASIASPIYYRQFPLETLNANYSGTLQALQVAKRWNSKILLMSSSEIYGDPSPENIPTSESYRGNVSSVGPRACYDEGKRVMETLGWIFETNFDLDVSIARPFNFYGPGMRLDDGRILPDFFGAVTRGEDLVLHSDGSPTRSFCYVSDAITALFTIVLSNKKEKLFNIGNSEIEISMRDLAELVSEEAQKLGWRGKVRFETSSDKEYLTNNPNRRVPNLNYIEEAMNWRARTTLREGVGRSLIHFLEGERS